MARDCGSWFEIMAPGLSLGLLGSGLGLKSSNIRLKVRVKAHGSRLWLMAKDYGLWFEIMAHGLS